MSNSTIASHGVITYMETPVIIKSDPKERLLFASGKPLTAKAVARKLSISIEWVDERREKKQLMAVPAKKYGYLYPAFQFTAEGSVLSDLEQLLPALERL